MIEFCHWCNDNPAITERLNFDSLTLDTKMPTKLCGQGRMLARILQSVSFSMAVSVLLSSPSIFCGALAVQSRQALVCMFLALLELIRLQAILARQDHIFGEIIIKKHVNFDTALGETARDD